jgi:ATP-binding cassette subfamily B (MDR/TAP) protein 1
MTDIEELHRAACAGEQDVYTDPLTGYQVITAHCHRKRGWCCGSGCRHCPFGHHNVKSEKRRKNAITEPTLLRAGRPSSSPSACCDVAFFSGGKDSFLAALEAVKELRAGGAEGAGKSVVLLTTFDPDMGMHGLQRVELAFIQEQARLMRLDLIAVPVPKGGGAGDQGAGYLGAVQRGIQLAPCRVERLVFGDLHLQHIRDWRERSFSALGYTCHFPLWRRSYGELLQLLRASGARVAISAVRGPEVGVREGEVFDEALMQCLPEGVDGFGENGEFHTRVHVGG